MARIAGHRLAWLLTLGVVCLAPQRPQPGRPRKRARGIPRPVSGARHRGVVARDQRARQPVVRRDQRGALGTRRGKFECDHGSGQCWPRREASADRTRETLTGFPSDFAVRCGRVNADWCAAMRVIKQGREGPAVCNQCSAAARRFALWVSILMPVCVPSDSNRRMDSVAATAGGHCKARQGHHRRTAADRCWCGHG